MRIMIKNEVCVSKRKYISREKNIKFQKYVSKAKII